MLYGPQTLFCQLDLKPCFCSMVMTSVSLQQCGRHTGMLVSLSQGSSPKGDAAGLGLTRLLGESETQWLQPPHGERGNAKFMGCWAVRGHLLVRILKLRMIQVARDPWRSSPPTSCPKQAWLNSDPGAQGIFQLSFLQAWRVHLFPFLCSNVSLFLKWNAVLINISLDLYLHLL